MSPQYEGIEPQFDLAAQERREKAETQASYIRAELAEKAKQLERLADEIEPEALEAEKAALEPVPEAPKVDQEPELPGQYGSFPPSQYGEVQGG